MTDPIVEQTNPGGVYRYFLQYAHEANDVSIRAGELQGVYGVSMSKYLSKPGDMTFSVRLDSWINSPNEFTPPADIILPITEPYRNSIWVFRNDTLVWGGIITSRTWQTQGRVLNFTARTHDALFRRLHYNFTIGSVSAINRWPANLIYEIVRRAIDQGPAGENLHRDIWQFATTQLGYPKEIDVRAGTFDGPTYTLGAEQATAKKAPAMSELLDYAIKLGAEYRLVPYETNPGAITNTFRVQWETGQIDEIDPLNKIGKDITEITEVYQYPGSIFRYWWPESMGEQSEAGAQFILRGQDNGAGVYPSRDFRVVNIPTRLWNSVKFQFNTQVQQVLLDIADNIWQSRIPPAVNPTFELDISHPDVSPYADRVDVGDYARFLINDPIRFGSEVVTVEKRIIGWSLTPPSDNTVEQFGIQLEQQDGGSVS